MSWLPPELFAPLERAGVRTSWGIVGGAVRSDVERGLDATVPAWIAVRKPFARSRHAGVDRWRSGPLASRETA